MWKQLILLTSVLETQLMLQYIYIYILKLKGYNVNINCFKLMASICEKVHHHCLYDN